MIIFGWGKRTIKEFGLVSVNDCSRCHNEADWMLMKITFWFTLFFIPVIPYKSHYLLQCPICNNAIELTREEFEGYQTDGQYSAQGGDAGVQNPAPTKYAGKTETQINYLKEMEEYNKIKSE